jgi:hypothetical protein
VYDARHNSPSEFPDDNDEDDQDEDDEDDDEEDDEDSGSDYIPEYPDYQDYRVLRCLLSEAGYNPNDKERTHFCYDSHLNRFEFGRFSRFSAVTWISTLDRICSATE